MSKKVFILCIIVASYISISFNSTFCQAEAESKGDWQAMARQLGYKPGELIVRFAPKGDRKFRTKGELNAVLAKMGAGTIKHSYKLVSGLAVVKLPPGATVENNLARFRSRKEILYAYPNRRIKAVASVPNDTRFDEQWALDNIGQSGGTESADISAPEAWDFTTGSSDIIVAVIDTGVDYNHPDLADNMWVNEAELNGETDVDDDENGYVDDVYGYDFASDTGWDPDPYDEFDNEIGHGTQCAGVIGAIGNNDEGVAGVCWDVKIMAVKWLDYQGFGYDSDAIKAIEYAVQMGAKVLNNSWTYPISESLEDAIEGVHEAGVLFVVAAGNSGQPRAAFPARCDIENIISVMATDNNDERSIWPYGYSSNWGAISVDLAAPGGSIGSASRNILTCAPDNSYFWDYGTSLAAPHVSGACALIWSRNPTLSHLEVKEIVLNSVDELDSLEGLCVSSGRLNLHNAIVASANISLTVTDGLADDACVLPEEFIEYEIWYSNYITDPNAEDYVGDANDVVIIDHLSESVDFVSAYPLGQYDPNEHTYTWNIGKLSPGQGSAMLLKVQVTDTIEPLSQIFNRVEFESDVARRWTTDKTDICCYGSKVIYVDQNVEDSNDGSSWTEAFDKLEDALLSASICDEIWVAKAENAYKPTTNPNNHKAKFSIPRGVWTFGGFAGNEQNRSERNWFENETILSGVIDSADNEPNRVDFLIVSDANNLLCIVDGFTIKGAGKAGVYCEKGSPIIQHNKITDSGKGIYCEATEQPIIKNNWIYRNDYGLYFDDPTGTAVVRNNTIANNEEIGIKLSDGVEPEIVNCIFSGNPPDSDLIGCYPTYSYIEYPTVLDPSGSWSIGLGNIDGDPNYTLFVDGANDN
ncbi:MAG: S8 family serine peptidase [Planctomycetota bacterium]